MLFCYTVFFSELNCIIWHQKHRPYVLCFRVFVLVLVVVSVLWIPVVQASQGGQLFIYIQSISTYLQPPVSIIFLMGCFWKRANEKVWWCNLRLIE